MQASTSPSQSPTTASPTMDTRPLASRRSTGGSSPKSLSLDLTNLPPLVPPTPPSNTLLFTNLQDTAIFRPENLQTIRDLVATTAPIHSWAPLKSFRRIVVSFFDEQAAIAVRSIWDGEAILGDRTRVFFGKPTPVEAVDRHLALPDAGKLFFISPPPSPPHGWEMRLEDAPNKLVHAEDLAEALAKLHHQPQAPMAAANEDHHTPVSPVGPNGATRSRSSTLLYQPATPKDGSSPEIPAIHLEDMTDSPLLEEFSPMVMEAPKPVMAHTARPPVELMLDA